MRRINLILELGFLFLLAATATAQPATKTYRGSVGGSNFQMRLSVHGTNVTGAYSYDTVGEDIKLTGSLDAQGKLNLIESDARGKPSGRFVCKQLGAPPTPTVCGPGRTARAKLTSPWQSRTSGPLISK